jgi:hypothetical protein
MPHQGAPSGSYAQHHFQVRAMEGSVARLLNQDIPWFDHEARM